MDNIVLDHWRKRFVDWLELHWNHGDQSHDIQHLHRVWRNCMRIMQGEAHTVDPLVLLPAAYFHDLVALPKDNSNRHLASWESAEKMKLLMEDEFRDYPRDSMDGIHHAIHAHSFSAAVVPHTIEAKILQDADRLEALGAIGIARMFYTAGKMGAALCHAADPSGSDRALDDRKYSLDHIEVKLLKLPAMMQTATGKAIAEQEADFIRGFRTKFLAEMKA